MDLRAYATGVFAAMWLAACSSGGGSARSHDAANEGGGSYESGSSFSEASEPGSFAPDAEPAFDVARDTRPSLDQSAADVSVDVTHDLLSADWPVEAPDLTRADESRDGPTDAVDDAAADLPGRDAAEDAAIGIPSDAAVVPSEAGIVDQGWPAEAGPWPDECSGLARGLTLSKLVLYQAVEIPLMRDGVAVPTAERTAAVVLGRDAVVRAFAKLDAEWVAREIAVRMHVTSGGRETVLSARKALLADSQPGSLESTLQLEIPGALITSDARYWVEAVECSAGQAGTLARPRFPASGDAPVDGRPTGKLRIAFVPIKYGDLLPDTSEAAIAIYRNYLAAMYPATEVVTSVVKGFSYTPGTAAWTEHGAEYVTDLLDWTTGLRAYDVPADDVYYYGLFRPASSFAAACGDGDCVDGTGYVVTEPGRFGASLRVAVSFAFADEDSARAIAHELGHNHGRKHAPCDEPSNPDLSFPHAGGSIGVWGYDRRDRTLKDPATVTDIMGYCKPVWISDHTYQGIAERVAAVNGAVAADVRGRAESAQRWRALWVQGGKARWAKLGRVAPIPAGTPATARVLDAGGEQVDSVPVYLQEVSLPNTVLVLVPEPRPGWHAIELPGQPALAFAVDPA